MRLAPLIAGLLFILVPWEAGAEDNCRNFSWSIGRTVNLFDEPLPIVQTNQSLPKEGAFALVLRPSADVIYPIVPERGSDGSWGGVVTIERVPAGRYQIALSADAWIEAFHDDRRLIAQASVRGTNCYDVRRSVEVDLEGEALSLQIGGASVPRLNIAVVRVWPFDWRW